MAEITSVKLEGEKAGFMDRFPEVKFHHNLMLSIQVLDKNSTPL